MSDTVLITGPGLAPAAIRLIENAGLTPVFMPPYLSGEALTDAVRNADPVGIIVRMGRLDAAAMAAAPRLRAISKHGVGVDSIDLDAAAGRGIPVLVASGANAVAVAEHTMALILAVAKTIPALDAGMRAGRWEKAGHDGRELAGSSVGFVGFGAIARHAARMARAFALEAFAYDPFCEDAVFAEEQVTRVVDLDDLVARCDIVSLHLPLNEATRNLFDADRLGRMKPGAILVNTARGGLIDEAALSSVLASGHLAGAGLDSFAQEPPAAGHPFFSESRLVMTPHIGGVTAAANSRVGVMAAQGILDVLNGRELPPARIVNRAALARTRHPNSAFV